MILSPIKTSFHTARFFLQKKKKESQENNIINEIKIEFQAARPTPNSAPLKTTTSCFLPLKQIFNPI